MTWERQGAEFSLGIVPGPLSVSKITRCDPVSCPPDRPDLRGCLVCVDVRVPTGGSCRLGSRTGAGPHRSQLMDVKPQATSLKAKTVILRSTQARFLKSSAVNMSSPLHRRLKGIQSPLWRKNPVPRREPKISLDTVKITHFCNQLTYGAFGSSDVSSMVSLRVVSW